MPFDPDCVTCAGNARADADPASLPLRERVYLGPHWRMGHAFGTSLPGWLVVVPRRHVLALDELTPSESAELGPVLRAVSAALREVVGCSKTYVALFAEAEGFSHVHFHVVPRMPDLDAGLRGPRIFAHMGVEAADEVPEAIQDDLAIRLANSASIRSLP